MKKSIIVILFSVSFFLFVVAATNASSTSQTSKFEYRLKYSDSLFLFPVTDTNKARLQINRAIKKLKGKLVCEFIADFKDFFDSDNGIDVYRNELSLSSKVVENSEKFFSIRVDILPYLHGSNGCQSRVECLNFSISEGEAKQIRLTDIIKNERRIELLKSAILKLRNRIGESLTASLLSEGVLEKLESSGDNAKPLSEIIQFTISPKELSVIFPAYTISCGADGVLEAKIPRDELDEKLTPFGVELFNILNSKQIKK